MIKEEFNKLFDESEDEPVYDFELLDFSKKNMIKNKKDIPPLFRYSCADYNNIRALETQTLWLSPIGDLNDAFEGLSCESDCKIIEDISKIYDLAYVKSFSEENNNLLMWAHYAANYTGMCVEYDFRKLSDDILYHLYPVHYSGKRFTKSYLEQTIRDFINLKISNSANEFPCDCDFLTDIMYLFLSKSSAWSYEKEWRILATYPQIFNSADEIESDEEAPDLYSINNQKISVESCIKNVYLGAKMKQNIKEHIIEICQNKLQGVKVYSAKLSESKYELEYVQEGE